MANFSLRWGSRARPLFVTFLLLALVACMQGAPDSGDSGDSHAAVAGKGHVADRDGLVTRILDESFYTEPKRILIIASEGEMEGYYRIQDNRFSACDHLGCSPATDLGQVDRHQLSKTFGIERAAPGRVMVQSIIAEAVRDLPNMEGTPKPATETIRKGTPYYELKLVSENGMVVESTLRSRFAVEEIPPWLDGEQQAAPPEPSGTASRDPCAVLEAQFQRIELPMAERATIMRELVECRRKFPQEEASPESLPGPEPERDGMLEADAPLALAEELDRAPAGTGQDAHLRIEFIGREPPSSFVFGPGADDTNQVNPASAGIRFTGVDLPCDVYHLYVDEAGVSGGGVDRSIDLCAARGFEVHPGEIYTLRNRSGQDLVSRNVRVNKPQPDGTTQAAESPPDRDARHHETTGELPRPVSSPAPRYPPAALRSGITGAVGVILTVNPDGYVEDVEVERSSQSRDLDRAAIQGARKWRFSQTDHGGRIRTTVTFDVD